MKYRKFAIGTYEMDLLDPETRYNVFNKLSTVCDSVDTAINYDNDYLLKDLVKTKTLITKIAPCQVDQYEFLVTNHMKCLDIYHINMMLIHSPRGDWQRLAKIINDDKRIGYCGVSNFNVEQLEEYKKLIGEYPYANEIEINPLYTDYETIRFCKRNDICIIAYCVLGGKYNAPRYIADYSLYYLLNYACNCADIVILRADNLAQATQMVDIIQNAEYVSMMVSKNMIVKSMQPMVYNTPQIERWHGDITVYDNYTYPTCTTYSAIKCLDIPEEFEMLGDYKAYYRYKYKTTYRPDDIVYKHGLLKLDNNKYMQVCLREHGKLTKVNCKDVDKKLLFLEEL